MDRRTNLVFPPCNNNNNTGDYPGSWPTTPSRSKPVRFTRDGLVMAGGRQLILWHYYCGMRRRHGVMGAVMGVNDTTKGNVWRESFFFVVQLLTSIPHFISLCTMVCAMDYRRTSLARHLLCLSSLSLCTLLLLPNLFPSSTSSIPVFLPTNALFLHVWSITI